ncbi:helix-turn-helix domain-containing protein [Paracoccus nototheniae]|uniref:Helix-turn-helix domain-containing protein n=1 Tax=Paracoccus nototheniae TaxID=2489002 RepID=A0ABW4DWD9_9RHOB|nr:helix-turn-helix domain-containing protein [Paracoccus nototheniae]
MALHRPASPKVPPSWASPRADMLAALMDRRALIATELAQIAAITRQTASGHLARLTSVGMSVAVPPSSGRVHM